VSQCRHDDTAHYLLSNKIWLMCSEVPNDLFTDPNWDYVKKNFPVYIITVCKAGFTLEMHAPCMQAACRTHTAFCSLLHPAYRRMHAAYGRNTSDMQAAFGKIRSAFLKCDPHEACMQAACRSGDMNHRKPKTAKIILGLKRYQGNFSGCGNVLGQYTRSTPPPVSTLSDFWQRHQVQTGSRINTLNQYYKLATETVCLIITSGLGPFVLPVCAAIRLISFFVAKL